MTLSDFIEELNTAIKQDGYSIYCNADTAKMIKSLLTSEMNDLISRQALYEILDEYDEGKIYWGEAEDRIGNLPSAQASEEYKKGWKDGRDALREEMWEYERDRLD